MDAVTARWTSWSFLVYAGGLGVALAAAGWVQYLDAQTSRAVDVLWTLLALGVLLALAEAFMATAHRVTAGVLAFGATGAFAAAVASLFHWFGWMADAGIRGFHVARLVLELLWIGAACVAIRRYRFPLLTAQLVFASWLFVADLLSGGGTWTAVITIVLGFTTLAAALMLDGMELRPWAFWPHVGAGLMIGAGALWCVRNAGPLPWLLILVAAVGYVAVARSLARSSWAVLGAAGVLIAATYYAAHWSHIQLLFFDFGDHHRPWVVPLAYSAAAALLIALGLWVSRSARRG